MVMYTPYIRMCESTVVHVHPIRWMVYGWLILADADLL
jgi:hypothetical protein